MTCIITRYVDDATADALFRNGMHPVLARLFASRGISESSETDTALARLIPPTKLKGAQDAAVFLADAIEAGKRMLVVADYDCDGATACAVAVRGLRMFGAKVEYLVPNRFDYGYGLTLGVVTLAARRKQGPPDVMITVDNGIASVDGVAAAQMLGIEVVVTDHHLPGNELPNASCIVNPNQPGCEFPSKHLAGVGVIFYVLLALRAELRSRGAVDAREQPRLDTLLDLVALGTVADVVELDANNRILVAQGLCRIRAGRMHPGINALFRAAARNARQATSFDLGFGLGPRLNAAGRLADMSLGIECLLTDDDAHAWTLAQELDTMNRKRREIEAGMQQEALADLARFGPRAATTTLCAFNETWHQGVIGIVAARLKEKFYRPTIVFAPGDNGQIKGSGRSIPGFHLRDALNLITKREPDLIGNFGGHAMAAGLTIAADTLPRFQAAFEAIGQERLDEKALARVIESDGDIGDDCFVLPFVALLNAQVWGQGFPAPVFSGEFQVLSQAILKDKHLKLQLWRGHMCFNAIWFNHTDTLPSRAQFAYRLAVDTFNGVSRVQMLIEHAQRLTNYEERT